MMTRRLGVAVAVLNGYLYAIGGSDGQCPLNTVERYDPKKNCWTLMAPMSTRRKHLGCAVFNNMIYAGKVQVYATLKSAMILSCNGLRQYKYFTNFSWGQRRLHRTLFCRTV